MPSSEIAEAQHDPVAGWRRPVERSVGVHLAGQVDDIRFLDDVCGGNVGRGEAVEIRHRIEGGLLFEAVDPRTGMQHQFGNLRSLSAASASTCRETRDRSRNCQTDLGAEEGS